MESKREAVYFVQTQEKENEKWTTYAFSDDLPRAKNVAKKLSQRNDNCIVRILERVTIETVLDN